MSNTPNTLTLTIRFSLFYDMDIVSRIAMEDNKTDYIRDALWYYIHHEQDPDVRNAVRERREMVKECLSEREKKKHTGYALFPVTSSTNASTSSRDQTTRTS